MNTKKMMMSLMLTVMVLAGLAVVEARDRSKTITFLNDVTVNGTVVAKGTYDVRFDSETNEVSILRNGRLVATTKVEVKLTDRKNPHNSAGFIERDNARVLTSITFEGDKRVLLVNPVGSSTSAGE
jgi:pyruvate carboxylase